MRFKPMAEYLLPGTFFNEEDVAELPERSVEAALAAAPRGAFAFVLYDSPIAEFEFDAGLFKVIPIAQNKSPKHYIGGTIYTLAEVDAMGPDMDILASNMRGNGWAHVIKTPFGNHQPFEMGHDVLVEAPTR